MWHTAAASFKDENWWSELTIIDLRLYEFENVKTDGSDYISLISRYEM